MRSSPTAAAASSASAIWAAVSGSRKPVAGGVVRPDAGEAVGLELGPDRSPCGAGAAAAAAGGAQEVLDVVAVLVGDDVALGERAALRPEPRPSSSKKPRSM